MSRVLLRLHYSGMINLIITHMVKLISRYSPLPGGGAGTMWPKAPATIIRSFVSCWSSARPAPTLNHLISISAGPTLNNKGTPLKAEIPSLEVTPGAQPKVRSLSLEARFLTMHCAMAVRVNESKSGSRETI